jgi:6-phosphogluconolactonase/glucosamine-6-phosphate isomerase/deaminase
MRIIQVDPEKAVVEAATYIARVLTEILSRQQTALWLVSGGSALEVAVVARKLLGTLPTSANLHIGLIDERYGSPGHSDSNWQQLLDKGFDVSGLILHPVLQTTTSIEEAATDYNQTLTTLFDEIDCCIGLLGMGADRHTAGLLPHNPIMRTSKFVDYYHAHDFERISISPSLIKRLDVAILYAVGENKWPSLEVLGEPNVTTDEAPVKLLQLARQFRVYTDYRGVIK